MAIAFNCPHCGELHRVKDELAGKTGKCKSAKCKQPILIPFRSTVTANGTLAAAPSADAETLAAAALSEEVQPKKAEELAPASSIQVECPQCSTKFDVDAAMAGKNVRCAECGKIVRAPMPQVDKPLDWRKANEGRPTLAKSTEPAPVGVWDVQRKGVSGEAIRKAGAHEVEDEDDIRERKFRRIKQLLYGLALLGMVAFVVFWIIRSRTDRKQERWMEQAVTEIEDKNEGSKRPEYQAAIHRYALEYFVRGAKGREEMDAAAKHFDKSLSALQNVTDSPADRDAMLADLALALVACSGDQKELDEERRIPWDKLQKMMRQSLDKIPATNHSQRVFRQRAFRMLARKLADKDHGMLALAIAKNACGADEYGSIAGRIGIEFVLMNKRDLAQQVLGKTLEAKPELTALWLALSAEGERPPAGVVLVPAVGKGLPSRESRLAYAEGTALRGDITGAWKIAALPGNAVDQMDALVLVATVAIETGKMDDAGPVLDAVAGLVLAGGKDSQQSPWQMFRIVELCGRANKMDKAQAVLDAIKDTTVRGWSRLQLHRLKLVGKEKEKADESFIEPLADPPGNSLLAAAIGRAEAARHNAAAGESSYVRSVESLPKGTIRPFGYAGTALGRQDRSMK